MNTDGTIAAATKHAVSPDDALHLRQKFSVHLAPFLIQSSQGIDRLIRGHVLRVLMMRHVQKTAFSTEAAVGAMGQVPFHFAFSSIQHLSDLFRIDRFHFLLRHKILHVTSSFSLPSPGAFRKTVFIPDEEAIKEEEEHVPEFRKRDGNEHDFPGQNVERHHRIIIEPLMIGEIPC